MSTLASSPSRQELISRAKRCWEPNTHVICISGGLLRSISGQVLGNELPLLTGVRHVSSWCTASSGAQWSPDLCDKHTPGLSRKAGMDTWLCPVWTGCSILFFGSREEKERGIMTGGDGEELFIWAIVGTKFKD